MTEQEAIKWLANDTSPIKIHIAELQGENPMEYINSAIEVAIKCIEKQIAKKPFQPFGTHSFKCSNCWKFVAHEVDDNCDLSQMAEWCPFCGQKLDWGNEDAE